MALEMRADCERCEAGLGHPDSAFICSYECTFCPVCAEAMQFVCPNCGGGAGRAAEAVVARPGPTSVPWLSEFTS